MNLGMYSSMNFLVCLFNGELFRHSRTLSVDHFPVVSATLLFVISLDGISSMDELDASTWARASDFPLSLIPQ